uniref:Uncharacterized protein n=1 Tax=Cannabis sativa TaxID=3483 RepID=A0A803QYP4_CANSA
MAPIVHVTLYCWSKNRICYKSSEEQVWECKRGTAEFWFGLNKCSVSERTYPLLSGHVCMWTGDDYISGKELLTKKNIL